MPEAVHVASGKVRELYAIDAERLLLVASDRISTFDVVLPTEIPDKGRMLTGLAGFWFARTRSIVPNHLLGLRADGRSTGTDPEAASRRSTSSSSATSAKAQAGTRRTPDPSCPRTSSPALGRATSTPSSS